MGLRSLKLLLEEIPPIINCWLQSFNLPSGSGPSGQEQKLRQDKQNISGQAIPDTGVLNDIRMVGMHINRAWELIIRTNIKRGSLLLPWFPLISVATAVIDHWTSPIWTLSTTQFQGHKIVL